jgi:hypothetical protein
VYEADKLNAGSDSVYFVTSGLPRLNEYKSSYNKSEIKEIYQKRDYINGIVHEILLYNGNIITAQNILVKNDSVFLYEIFPSYTETKRNISIATSAVNSISFNNRWKGMDEGAGFFALGGMLFGIRNASITSGDHGAILPEIAAIGGAIVFGLGGAVVGTAIGSSQDYIINEHDINYHGLSSVKLLGGISSTNMGIMINGNNTSCDSFIDYSAGISFVWSFNNYLGIKSGLFYNAKGGSFDQYIASDSFTYHRDIFLSQIEIPVLFQYTFSQGYLRPRIFAGPQIGFFNNGRIDNIFDIKQYSQFYSKIFYKTIDPEDVNSPEYSFVIGAGFDLQKYISIEFQYDQWLSNFSNSLFGGQVTNLKLNSFSILLGVGI